MEVPNRSRKFELVVKDIKHEPVARIILIARKNRVLFFLHREVEYNKSEENLSADSVEY